MIIDLKKEFEKVADEFREAYLGDDPSCIDQSADNTIVPIYNEYGWAMNVRKNNCYNFAIDCWENDVKQPGQLFLDSLSPEEKAKELRKWQAEFRRDKTLEEYAERTIERAKNDRLDYLGMSPRKLKDAFPVALFFRTGNQPYLTGFHWFSLRRRANTVFADPMGWFHKNGDAFVEDCGKQTIFHFAKLYGYNYFAGYFAVNKKKIGIPEDPFNEDNLKKAMIKRPPSPDDW